MKTIFFRVDMNKEIATGHMMRCLSIADELRGRGGKAIFIIADENPCELLSVKGYEYIVLHTFWKDMDSEIPLMKNIIAERGVERLLIDSYYATADYLCSMTELTYTIYIDDLNRTDLSVDSIICYALYADVDYYEKLYVNQGIKLILGTKYAPLRKVFSVMPDKYIQDDLKNVLILSGGADPYGVVEKCIDILNDCKIPEITAICGRYSELASRLRKKYTECPNICILENVDYIENYMQIADICISAAGSTLYELCACGTPTLSYTLADNQLDNARIFDDKGIIPYLGDVRTDDISEGIIRLLKVYNEKEYRRKISERMTSVIDGKGCAEIIDDLFC